MKPERTQEKRNVTAQNACHCSPLQLPVIGRRFETQLLAVKVKSEARPVIRLTSMNKPAARRKVCLNTENRNFFHFPSIKGTLVSYLKHNTGFHEIFLIMSFMAGK